MGVRRQARAGAAAADATTQLRPSGAANWRTPPATGGLIATLQLGRRLFHNCSTTVHNERLSGNGTQSCGTCHLLRLAFADGKRTPTGSTGQTSHRNSPGLNVAYLARSPTSPR